MLKPIGLFLTLICVLTVSYGAQAQTPTLKGCVKQHDMCVSDCLTLDGDGAQAVCVAKCAGLEAQCASGFGLEKAEPVIREKAGELEGFLFDFLKDLLPDLLNPQSDDAPTSGAKET